jgi:murein DD-endopeptidase MepM/ murein hydrolase activator NlpD
LLPSEKIEAAHRFRPRHGEHRIRVAQTITPAALEAWNGLLGDDAPALKSARPAPRGASSGVSSGPLASSARRRLFRPSRRVGLVLLSACLILVVSAVVAAMPSAEAGDTTRGPAGIGAVIPSPSPTGSPTVAPAVTLLPTPAPPVTAPPRVGEEIPGSAFLAYTVQPKDTLIKIARSFSLDPTTLYWANSNTLSDPQMVKIGQVLQIPPMDGLVVTVTAGGTLAAIADKYGVSTQVIVDANNLTDLKLAAGQVLLIPGTETPPLPVPKIVVPTPRPPNWLGKLTWPVPGQHRITQYFGCTGWYGEPRWGKCAHYHDGLDVGAKWGTPVVAAASGTVIYAGWKKAGTDGAGGGIVVWISHGGTLYTTYNHLSGVTVKAGQKVKAGQRVGSIGNTGLSVGAHLHFEVWIAYPWHGGNIADARNPLLYAKNKG